MSSPARRRLPWTDWSERWGRLARASGLDPREPVVLALSGGADSVFLLHLLACADERPPVTAAHVDHGLRGAESDEDARFCHRLCETLGIPFVTRRVALDPDGPSLEARARVARYSALVDVAGEAGAAVILTGHHADDALETVLMRWLRGSDLAALSGIPRSRELSAQRRRTGSPRLRVVRPLLGLRREEVRCLLSDFGLEWREDSTNRDPRFTRNRIRHEVLPWIESACGSDAVEHLQRFAHVVEELEGRLAHATAHLSWRPLGCDPAVVRADGLRGGTLPRSELARLFGPLRRRALWRLCLEGTGRAPGRALTDLVLADLEAGRTGRHTLPGGWRLVLRSGEIQLIPPATRPSSLGDVSLARRPHPNQLELPFPEPLGAPDGARLEVPGELVLPDGRRLTAELVRARPGARVPTEATAVELDARDLTGALWVRWRRSGDRFHPLGAPGSRALGRFLADAGIPREERDRVPLVWAGDELVWAVGVRPCDGRRVRADTELRLRLALVGGESA